MRIYWFFIWRNLNPLHQRMLCAKFGWNWPSGSGEEVEIVKSLRQQWWQRRQTTDKFWSEKLTWVNGSGELKIIVNYWHIRKWSNIIYWFHSCRSPVHRPGRVIVLMNLSRYNPIFSPSVIPEKQHMVENISNIMYLTRHK